MSFSYNLIIDNSKNKDLELNNKFNNIILDANSNRKKNSQEDIQNMMDKLVNKIFDVMVINKTNYFLDKDLNLIWDENTNIVGFINLNDTTKEKYVFYNDVDKIIKQMELDDIEFNQMVKTICYIG
jgi:hypothetical protein